MVRKIKKGLACALVAALAFTCAAPVTANAAGSATTSVQPKAQKNKTANMAKGVKATVDTSSKGTATVKAVTSKSKTSISVASKVKVNGVDYTVTAIGANAFKKAPKVKTVTLPSGITKINSKAFTGAKKLRTIKLKSTKKVTVSKSAFKGLSKSQKSKIVVKISKKMSKKNYNALVKALRKAGISKKNIKRG